MTMLAEKIVGLASFRSALRRFLAASEKLCRDEDVTPQQYQALLAICAWPSPPMTIKDLARELMLTHHGAVQLLDRLAANGLIERKTGAADRRRVELSLATDGKAKLNRLVHSHHRELLVREGELRHALDRLSIAAGPEEMR